MPAVWFELTVEVSKERSDAVANFLTESGAPGLQVEECGGKVCLVAYYAAAPPLDLLHRFCAGLGSPLETGAVRVRQIAEEDWAQNWKLHFHPQSIGDRLYICPPWDAAAAPNRVAVVIEPGMAFGTGQHGSTRGCLTLLDWAAGRRSIRRALDVGTGSGVLAIALAKLQVPEVWAVDVDQQAVTIAARNAVRNGVEEQIHFTSEIDAVPGTFDLLVANLFANLLEELAGRFTQLLAAAGLLICSGLLTSDEKRVRRPYEVLGFEISKRYEEASWLTLALEQRAKR
ncbi:MAG: 50S ribosomal protein L11 methyltransferase [Candidatus Binatia bacterium]